MQKGQRYIFDIKQCMLEVYAYLHTYHLPSNFSYNIKTVQEDLETLIYDSLRICIEKNSHKILRDHVINPVYTDPYYDFGEKYQLNHNVLRHVVGGVTAYIYILETISRAMGKNTFCLWALNKERQTYILECFGDYRILWFEKQVEEGKPIS